MILRLARALLTVLLYALGVIALFLSSLEDPARGALSLSLLALQLLRIVLLGRSDSLTISLSVAAIFLFALPGAGVVVLLGIDILLPILVFILFFDVLRIAAKRDRRQTILPMRADLSRKAHSQYRALLAVILVWCAVAGFLIDSEGFVGLLLFVAPYAAALIVFERCLAARASFAFSAIGAAGFLLTLAIYVTFHWSGFGRLVIGAFALGPLLVINHHRDLGIRTAAIALVAPLALYFAQLSRYGRIDDPEEFLIGSAGHHFIVSNDIVGMNLYRYFGGFDVFFSQYTLMFANWVPRSVWEDKPVGAGLWSVDAVYGRQGYGEGYSQSLGFVGELYLYLGPDFWIGGIIALVMLILLRRLVAQFSFGYVAPLVLFDINLVSYLWGGFATFGSRVWFMVVPAMILAWWLRRAYLRRLQRRKVRVGTGAATVQVPV